MSLNLLPVGIAIGVPIGLLYAWVTGLPTRHPERWLDADSARHTCASEETGSSE